MAKIVKTPVVESTDEEKIVLDSELVSDEDNLLAENEDLKKKVQSLETKLAEIEKTAQIVPSEEYTSINGNVYRFLNKVRSFNVLGLGTVNPVEVIENEELMEKLIKLEYAGLEIVKE